MARRIRAILSFGDQGQSRQRLNVTCRRVSCGAWEAGPDFHLMTPCVQDLFHLDSRGAEEMTETVRKSASWTQINPDDF